MYNRYIPNANGTYERKVVPSPPKEDKFPPAKDRPQQEPAQKTVQMSKTQPAIYLPQLQLDSGDLLVLLILLLLLTEGEDTDPFSLLVTLAAFLLMR